MTVSSTNTKNSYSGNGSTTVFAYTFKIFDDDDITVILRTDATGGETVQTKTTDYTVSGVGNAGGGNITFGTAPASGITVVLLRETAQTQATDYTPNDPFPAASHEDALDKLTLIIQDQQEELDRAIKVSRTNTITSSEFTVGASTRANKIFAFDSSGDLAVTQEIGTYQGTDATTTTSAYAERDIVKSTTAAQLNNVYICIQASPAGTLLTNTSYWQLLVDAVTAATSATNAAASATAAAASETAAAASESAAATSESNAATSASNASTSATNAATSATASAASASAASTSETNAATSATNASTSATAAASSATAAASSATAAAASESAAATSETNAATSASNAATSETNAATSESNAATSASNAATSASNAATAQTAAEAARDAIQQFYLGAQSSNPTVDGNGDPVTAGDWYFNTSDNTTRIYDGSSWNTVSPDLVGDTTPQLGGNLDTNGNDITFGDNDKAIFGAGSDLQIYHDGSNSYVADTGTGGLYLKGSSEIALRSSTNENIFLGLTDGAAYVYHDGLAKLATTATGIDVTGTAVTDGLTVAGNVSVDGGTIKLDGDYPVGNNNVALGNNALVSTTTGANNVAIGTLALDANTSSSNIVAVGYSALSNSTGASNTAVGSQSLGANTSGIGSVAVGLSALGSNTTGNYSTAVGTYALQNNTTGTNVAVGKEALKNNTTGTTNTAVGREALLSNTTADNNTAVGHNALTDNTTGGQNTAVGGAALGDNISGSENTGIGWNALRLNTTGANNTAVGRGSLDANTTASNNTAVGYDSLGANTTGANNVALGARALDANTTAGSNVAVGVDAMGANTTGANNAAFGTNALDANTTGSNNTAVGVNALTANTISINNTALGRDASFSNTTGGQNTVVGRTAGYSGTTGNYNTYVGHAAGYDITTGEKNTIIGCFDGNQHGLDIRTSNNNIVLSDGDGNPRGIFDSSGNFLVGKTVSGLSVNGVELNVNDLVYITRDGGTPVYVNRKTSDGTIIDLRKDGTTVGDIGVISGDILYIANPDGTGVGLNFDGDSPKINPTDGSGSGSDNVCDLGNASGRFDDIYATNGTIQTSDANEKQQIAKLTDAEITAAKSISQLFKTFKWNDAVAEKGDAARTHTGVIAQDVQQAMTDAGLDAGDYAFFISSTWWETQTDVPAVEAVAEVLDEDGNVVTEAVKAQKAYTRTDTYDTAEKAPEGAKERTRLGVRYPELLAFIGAATEQRLANIETRLAALESN